MGSLEAHGPHLPPETDTIIAEHLARSVASRIESALGVPAPIAPPFVGTCSSYADGFPGTVSIPADQAASILRAQVDSIAAQGARRIALVNLHFDPGHMGVLRAAVHEYGRSEPGLLLCTNFTQRGNAQRIGGEFATGSCHAGRFETSLMLAAAPELVKDEYGSLPSLHVDLPAAIKAGKKGFKEIGMDRAYCGDPAAATRQEGRALFKSLAEIVVEDCAARWGGPAGE
jgi:creatinine amidohydrolase